jgi:hypothetical protein
MPESIHTEREKLETLTLVVKALETVKFLEQRQYQT